MEEPHINKTPTWLCNDEFDEDMLVRFMEFYNEVISLGVNDAIIYINSSGGDLAIANSMLSLMENTHVKFHTVAIGSCYSSALYLLVGGDVKYATDRADMMFHSVSITSEGSLKSIKEEVIRIIDESDKINKRFTEKTKKKKLSWWEDQVDATHSKEFFFESDQAKSIGVINHIGIPVEVKTKNSQTQIKAQNGKKRAN